MVHSTVDIALYRAPDPIDDDDYDMEEDMTTIKSRAKDTHLIDMWLKNRSHYCLQLEEVYIICMYSHELS